MSRERSAFGKRMLEARQHAGLTQMQVRAAFSPQMAQSTIAELERDAQGSSRTAEFALLYKCDVQWLATGIGLPHFGRAHSEPPLVLTAAERAMVLALRAGQAVPIGQSTGPRREKKRAPFNLAASPTMGAKKAAKK